MCGLGKYLSGNSCPACPVGRYNPYWGRTRVNHCRRCHDTGQSVSAAGSTSTAHCLCAAGHYKSRTRRTFISCPACPGGKVVTKSGATSYTQCAACARGSAARGGAAVCSKCTPGLYAASTSRSFCAACPYGKYGAASAASSASQCKSCPAGRWQPAAGRAACAGCRAGTYQTRTGQRFCTSCPTGRYGNLALGDTNAGNLALKKPATQVNTYASGAAARGVDGSSYSVFNGGSCTHTNRAPSWWRVDLGKAVTAKCAFPSLLPSLLSSVLPSLLCSLLTASCCSCCCSC